MFFIFGVNSGQKEIGSFGPVICGACGSYGRYQVYMTYMCLSLFFIPVLKWGRKYYAETSCCQSLYELDPQAGRRLSRGEADRDPAGRADSHPQRKRRIWVRRKWKRRLLAGPDGLAEGALLPGLRL